MFDVFYISSYALMILYYYTIEYQNRCDYFDALNEIDFQASYKRFLNRIPNGIVLLDKTTNSPLFYNQVIGKIIATRSGNSSQQSASYEGSDNQSESKKEKLMNAMKDVVQQEGNKSLKDVIEEWPPEERAPHKYIYQRGEEDSVYTIKLLKTKFQGKSCKAIILQDLSAYDKLAKLDEKYQKLYVASIVHDIRTPLNGVMGMLDMMKDCENPLDNRIFLSVAMNACKLLLYLTHDITDYSQLEAGKFKANIAKTDIRAVLREVTQLLAFNFEKKRIQQFSAISEDVPLLLYIDKNRYMQILLNLAGNALKFTFQGHIKITIDYDSHNSLLITSVRDTGIGIKDEDIPRLFKIFAKAEKSDTQHPQGVGLGLVICKKLSESLGGYISVTSKYGLGSTFTFVIKASINNLGNNTSNPMESIPDFSGTSSLIIPGDIDSKIQKHKSDISPLKNLFNVVVPTSEERLDTEQKLLGRQTDENYIRLESIRNCSCPKILIVDDMEYNLYVLQSYLKSVGLLADEARNGVEALERIRERSFKECCGGYKLIVMDINMPLMDGVEATRIINEKVKKGEIPSTTVIALSAGQLRADEEDLYFNEVGFSAYIGKPTSKENFLGLLRTYNVVD